MAKRSTVATSAVRPNEPAREMVATFDNYGEAESPVVGGTGLRRMNYSTAALRGAGPGALVFGAIVGACSGDSCMRCSPTNAISTPLEDYGPSITTSSRTWRLPIVRCNSAPATTERNRRWQQR
jgi:hypothetical protein